jgi:hypothetical protein
MSFATDVRRKKRSLITYVHLANQAFSSCIKISFHCKWNKNSAGHLRKLHGHGLCCFQAWLGHSKVSGGGGRLAIKRDVSDKGWAH